MSSMYPDTVIVDDPLVGTGLEAGLENPYQVVLHNDDRNEAFYVADCLMRVFGHDEGLAVKIMLEAHEKGFAIAEVEGETPARKHRDELESLGLSVTIEAI